MGRLSKFDVLLYASHSEETGAARLAAMLSRNAAFGKVAARKISGMLSELRKEGLLNEGNAVNRENPKTWDLFAFLRWAKMRGAGYNDLLGKTTVKVFSSLFEGRSGSIGTIARDAGISKPTILKNLGLLEKSGFISIGKRKPMEISANLNDLTFFYANALGLSFSAFAKRFPPAKLPKTISPKLTELLIRIHSYATTVTEGNTATEEDVKKIFENRPVGLTPREVTEIINAREAVRHLYIVCGGDAGVHDIKKLHEILMTNIMESPGAFHYGKKRIIGSEVLLPDSREVIDAAVSALLNFWKAHGKKIRPEVMGAIIHFIFVTIHPFADGNGRVTRLLHSWALMKAGLPVFAFDPEKKNTYFSLLDAGRKSTTDPFIRFCIAEHTAILRRHGIA
jgi:hypothetical protein